MTTQPTEITIASDSGDEITVEISQDPEDPSPMRSWTVTIHRGQQAVTVGHGLGRFAATALTGDLQQLFNHTNQQGGHNID